MQLQLFPRDQVVGIFRGFSQGGLEFHADLVLPYRSDFHAIPMHGQFVLVELESKDEGVLGRITAIASQGRLASDAGDDYGLRAVAEDRSIAEELREQYLKYRVSIRILGVLRLRDGRLVFAPSHRRLPHVGAKVAFLSDAILKEVAGHHLEGVELGFLAFGEFVYSLGDMRLPPEPWMLPRGPAVVPRFHVQHLVSRRTFVFARAGFGKSNLIKLLFSSLYATTPTIGKRGGQDVPVGTVLFDADGEYFWPDDKGRPGLCDVPELERQLVVFTNRDGPSDFYRSFIAGGIKLDIRRLSPADVISIALPPERQDQQNVTKLRGVNQDGWQRIVDEVYRNKNATDLGLIAEILNLDQRSSEAEAIAARSNLTRIVAMLHDPSSQTLDMLLAALRAGKLCVFDVSQMRGSRALVLSGLILQRIFDHNQNEFTSARPATIPTIAVIEEAQAVLGTSRAPAEGPYVTWVKEGRKFDLGAVLITQQPGSIPQELLSQGDNWFVFHLLATGDLEAVKRANAHFSDDLLSSLLNEPITGHGVFWSSAGGKSYPLPIRTLSFDALHAPLDPTYSRCEAQTFAQELRSHFEGELRRRQRETPALAAFAATAASAEEIDEPDEPLDVLEVYLSGAIAALRGNRDWVRQVRERGMPWAGLAKDLERELPDFLEDRDKIAFNTVRRALNAIFGDDNWHTEQRPSRSNPGRESLWAVIGR